MKIFLKILFRFLIIVFLLSALVLFWVLSSTWAMQGVFGLGAKIFLKDVIIQKLVIKKQVYQFPGKMIFQDVSFCLKHKKDDFDFSFKTIEVRKLLNLLRAQEGVSLEVAGGEIGSSAAQIHGLKVHLISQAGMSWGGTVSVEAAESNGFELASFQAKAVLRKEDVTLFDIQAHSYDGKIKGIVQVYFLPLVRYVANLELEHFQTVALEQWNADMFSQVKGQVNGVIHVKGPVGGLERAEMALVLVDGGGIQAQLLSPLLAYVPASTQSKILQAAVEQKQLIRIDNGRLQISNKDAGKVTMIIQLQSNNLNLDVNVALDVMIDGGLQGLLSNLNQFSFLKKGT